MTRVTPLQRELLISLFFGWRWGGDRRSELGLEARGLLEMRRHWILDEVFGDRPVDLPHLTPAGARLARELWIAMPISEKEVVRKEFAELRDMGLYPREAAAL